MKAFHFLKEDMTAGSGNEPPWTVGEERECTGEIQLCVRGYHSSPTWFDALQYAPGNIACIVEVSEPIRKDGNKMVSHKRKLIDCRYAGRTLREFACDCAERVIGNDNENFEQLKNCIEVARKFARGEATSEQLTAAKYAADSAAQSAVDFTAQSAVCYAAEITARSAAIHAARCAAKYAAWYTARWTDPVEVTWQRHHLDKMMSLLFGQSPYKGD